jgi:hypothetical protein
MELLQAASIRLAKLKYGLPSTSPGTSDLKLLKSQSSEFFCWILPPKRYDPCISLSEFIHQNNDEGLFASQIAPPNRF